LVTDHVDGLPQNRPVSIFWQIFLERHMQKTLVLSLALLATSAFAHNCPNEMKAIDAKLASKPALAAADMSKVQSLRVDGEKFHKAGKHDDSMKSLGEAKSLLGI
jgi:hypothetical protein